MNDMGLAYLFALCLLFPAKRGMLTRGIFEIIKIEVTTVSLYIRLQSMDSSLLFFLGSSINRNQKELESCAVFISSFPFSKGHFLPVTKADTQAIFSPHFLILPLPL